MTCRAKAPTGRAAPRLHRISSSWAPGAAGLELVTRLGERLARRGRTTITLIDCARTHLWKPLLDEVAAGSLDPGEYEVNYLAEAHWHGFRYSLGVIIGLDRAAKEVHLAATFDDEGRQITPPRAIAYDVLVIAFGSLTNDFGTKGVADYALPLETPEQAARFNRRLVNAYLRAQTQEGPVRPGQQPICGVLRHVRSHGLGAGDWVPLLVPYVLRAAGEAQPLQQCQHRARGVMPVPGPLASLRRIQRQRLRCAPPRSVAAVH